MAPKKGSGGCYTGHTIILKGALMDPWDKTKRTVQLSTSSMSYWPFSFSAKRRNVCQLS